jgi:hypothetical protein
MWGSKQSNNIDLFIRMSAMKQSAICKKNAVSDYIEEVRQKHIQDYLSEHNIVLVK